MTFFGEEVGVQRKRPYGNIHPLCSAILTYLFTLPYPVMARNAKKYTLSNNIGHPPSLLGALCNGWMFPMTFSVKTANIIHRPISISRSTRSQSRCDHAQFQRSILKLITQYKTYAFHRSHNNSRKVFTKSVFPSSKHFERNRNIVTFVECPRFLDYRAEALQNPRK